MTTQFPKAKLRCSVTPKVLILSAQLNISRPNPSGFLEDMVANRDQRINPGIRGVDRVTRGNSGRTFGSTLVSGFLRTWAST